MHQTFYIDCQGLDIDQTVIFPQLQNSRQYRFPIKYYDKNSSNRQQPILEASILDFGHCSQVGICQPYIHANQTVSFQNCIGDTCKVSYTNQIVFLFLILTVTSINVAQTALVVPVLPLAQCYLSRSDHRGALLQVTSYKPLFNLNSVRNEKNSWCSNEFTAKYWFNRDWLQRQYRHRSNRIRFRNFSIIDANYNLNDTKRKMLDKWVW